MPWLIESSVTNLRVEDRMIPVFFGSGISEIMVRIYRPLDDSEHHPLMIWYHGKFSNPVKESIICVAELDKLGGGFVIGHPDMDDNFCREACVKHNMTVVSVDYRLAPEYPFPVGIEDSWTALIWVRFS